MNKFLNIIVFIFCIHSYLFAQNQSSNWYFGLGAGLNFDQNIVTPLIDGKTTYFEGTSTISDSCGNLLFYTDGETIWNRLHDTLTNGKNLNGHGTSSQSSIIIPKPNSDSLYYVFTVDFQGGTEGLNYSIVNMNLSNGLGEVIAKNIPLITPICEKITSVYHRNGKDVWVVVHHFGSNAFYSYLIDSSGVNNFPVISNSGSTININLNGTNAQGCMKISPKGDKLAIANGYSSELFDFNDSTGIVSNPLILENNTIYNYAVEFSPSGKILYTCGGGIYQYNLTATNIPASRYTVHFSAGFYGLQLGPNGKIYSAQSGNNSINVINEPNALGINCDFQNGAINLNGKVCKIGLPNFIQSYFKPNFTINNLCYNDSAIFNLNGIEYDSLLWNFNDPITGVDSISRLPNPKHLFSSPGNYTITLTIFFNGTTDVYTKNIVIEYINLGNDTILCDGDTLKLELNNPGRFLWQNGASENFQEITSAGIYWVEYFSNTCCTLYDTISVSFQPPIDIELLGNNEICIGDTVTLSVVGDTSNQKFLWSTGETNSLIEIQNAGIYWVEVEEGKCKIKKEINISINNAPCDGKLILPNVYTPNMDGLNDLFTPILSENIKDIKTKIYNRWGQLLFESKSLNIGWDGKTTSGDNVPEGTYYFIVNYTNFNNQDFSLQQFVTVLR